MTQADVIALFDKILAEAPETVEGLGNVANHLLNGDTEAAAREARLVAECVAAKKLAESAYDKP